MEFIDKTKLADKAEKIVKSFLKSFIGKGIDYPNDLYDAFSRDVNDNGERLYNLLKQILLKEQHNRCCYCMRNLNSETLEHIIPNGLKDKVKFDDYLDTNTVLNKNAICFAPDYIANKQNSYPPYPHTVAHQNLAVSCDSKTHCNNFKGNKGIKPIIFYKTITEDIEYESNGFAKWNKETEDIPTIEKLGLNDDTLKMIRRIWIYVLESNKNIDTQRDDIIVELSYGLSKDEEDILWKFDNNKQWELLKQYDYFAVPYKIRQLARHLYNLKANDTKELLEIISQKLAVN
jgi:hypothetical protein